RTSLRYLAGGKVGSLRDLANSNFQSNEALQAKYPSEAAFQRHLQFPDKLSCSIDIATGGGKSYVLYGIAAIMLAADLVDRVLVLCPSLTIESGLMAKFRDLAGNANLG